MAHTTPLLEAIERLPRVSAREVIWAGERSADRPPARIARIASRLHPLGLHRHKFAEICVALRGTSILDVEGRAWRLPAGAIAVVPAGVMHCEGFDRRTSGYESLWFGTHGVGLSGGAIEYAPAFGWRLTRRYWLADASSMAEFLADSELVRRADRLERLRDELLVALARLHLERTESAPTTAAEILTGSADRATSRATPADSPSRLASRARALIAARLDGHLGVGEIAQLLRVSPSYLQRCYRRANGETIQWFMRRTRMEAALQLLRDTDLLAKQVASRVGYSDPLYFSRLFRAYFGVAPSKIERHGESRTRRGRKSP